VDDYTRPCSGRMNLFPTATPFFHVCRCHAPTTLPPARRRKVFVGRTGTDDTAFRYTC